jgi:hypothetical protein
VAGFRNKIDDRLLAAELFNGAQVSSLQFREGTNLVRSGTVNAPAGSLFSFQGGTYNKTDTYQFAGGTRITRDQLKINIDVARTKSTFRGRPNRSIVVGSMPRPSTSIPTGQSSRLRTSTSAIRRSNSSTACMSRTRSPLGDDWQVRADTEYSFDSPLLKSVQFGVRYATRDAERRFQRSLARPARLPTRVALRSISGCSTG